MMLTGSREARRADVSSPSSFVQRTSASLLQFCGRRVHLQDLPCRGTNCGLAPPHLQVDERCWSQCLGAFRHEEQCLQLSAPCSHEAALMLFVLLMCCLACCCSMILAKHLCTRANCLHHLRLCCPPCEVGCSERTWREDHLPGSPCRIQVPSLRLVTRNRLPPASLQWLFPSLLLRWGMPGPALANA